MLTLFPRRPRGGPRRHGPLLTERGQGLALLLTLLGVLLTLCLAAKGGL